MKCINIVYRSTGVGLDQDAKIIKSVLEQSGHKCTLSRYKQISWIKGLITFKPTYDVNIFLERVHPRWVSFAKKNYLIPNQERFPRRHLGRLKKIDRILCKTKHAESIFSQLGFPTEYIGFTSSNRDLPEIKPDYSKFFHLAGKSTLKGTEDILALWQKHPEWPQLTIVQHKNNAPEKVPPNITLITEFLSDTTLRELQNSHGIHLCPSRSEGWGHYIVEAMSCGAVVITTDAPPMNELVDKDFGILIPYHQKEERHLGFNFYINPDELEKIISEQSYKIPSSSKIQEHSQKLSNSFTQKLTQALNE